MRCDTCVAPLRTWVAPPFELVAIDKDRTWDVAVPHALFEVPDIYERYAISHLLICLSWQKPWREGRTCLTKELLERDCFTCPPRNSFVWVMQCIGAPLSRGF